jgi:hypothetical protein
MCCCLSVAAGSLSEILRACVGSSLFYFRLGYFIFLFVSTRLTIILFFFFLLPPFVP